MNNLRAIRTWIKAQAPGFVHPPPILVYQMGKVGSTSVVETLQDSRLENRLFHVHHLNPSERRKAWRAYRQAGVRDPGRMRHLEATEGLSTRIRWDRRASWMVVSGFRDPIARAVSEFFQISQWKYPGALMEGRVDVQKAMRVLEEDIRECGPILSYGLTWFRKEMESVLNIDVLCHPFDQDRGWSLVSQDRVRLLLYRIEALDSVLGQGLRDLLGTERLSPARRANARSTNEESEAYSELLSRLTIPEHVCDRIYSHPLVRHFYPEEMVQTMRSRWSE